MMMALMSTIPYQKLGYVVVYLMQVRMGFDVQIALVRI